MPRRPRRNRTAFVGALSVGAILLFLLVGGLASVGKSSGPYHSSLAGSFGAQAKVIADQTNSVGAELGTLLGAMPGLDRRQLALRLDRVVSGSEKIATATQEFSSPDPGAGVASDFLSSMADRAQAMQRLGRAIDGLLSIAPGVLSSSGASSPSLPPPAIGANAAAKVLGSVGRLLLASDQVYRQARRHFAHLAGGSELPRSIWVSNPALWDAGALETMVNELVSAPNLAPRVDVHLVAVSLNPPLLPSAPPASPPVPAGTREMSPTCTVRVTAVVGNDGTTVATKVPVSASVAPITGGPAFVVSKLVTLGPSSSLALTLPVLAVQPSTTYTLTVSLKAPASQAGSTGAQQATIVVASFGSSKANNKACARTPAAAP